MPARRPLIGVTTYARDDRGRFSLPAEYVHALERAGGLPVLVPPVPAGVGGYLERLDGLLLSGGGDIDPARYGGRQVDTLYDVAPARDDLELALARGALDRRLPTLAICRGAQVVNVALGGSLFEHLPDEVGDTVAHRMPPREPVPHPVTIDPGSRLAAILGVTACEPMSWHHQGIRGAAPGARVVARAPDGVIEALEIPDRPELIAVQWHPELTAADDPIQQRLFEALARLAVGKPGG